MVVSTASEARRPTSMTVKAAVWAVWIVVRFTTVSGFSVDSPLCDNRRPNAAVDE
ncbi:MAG TPA: hypothetical protein VII59_09280 [Streptosporangiaceae bacterium]